MQLRILGMNGGFPEPGGATSGYLLTDGDTSLILDLGSGTLAELTRYMAPEDVTGVVLSHWHADHTADVAILGYRLQAMGRKLPLWGPVDEKSSTSLDAASNPWFDVTRVAPGERFQVGSMEVEVFAARHPVPSVMYRITCGDKVFCFTGDTNTQPGLAEYARGADLLLADSAFDSRSWSEAKPHLSSAHCARIAREAGVRKLILTHINVTVDYASILREAREIYPAAMLAEKGMCVDF